MLPSHTQTLCYKCRPLILIQSITSLHATTLPPHPPNSASPSRHCRSELEGFFIECIQVTLVNKIMQVSGAQFYNTSSVYCIVCPVSVHHHLSLLYPPPPSPPYNHQIVFHVHEFLLTFFPFILLCFLLRSGLECFRIVRKIKEYYQHSVSCDQAAQMLHNAGKSFA